MSQNGCRFLRLGALLCLIPLALYFLGSNGGGMQTLDLPSHGNTSIDTPLSGWTPRGPSSVWLTDEKRLLETLRPGDNVRIYCRTIGMFAGDEASLLVQVVDGPAGLRPYGSVWNPLVLGAILVPILLPFLLCSIIAIEADPRRDIAP